ncbi:amino acid permease/ SLC12A domain-containing protein [Aspergillus lucknowensis]|uniref:Amino acid permease/ SLC12A domain-containing protein n=1 Tax=Aspergillus lucknowensis TaxID=176173 RepID=A0ABR4LXE2_9EURO
MSLDDKKEAQPDIARSTSAGIASAEMLQHGTMKRALKPRHSQMIALGGCVGTGLFVGTGASLALGGPAFLLIAFIFLSLLVYLIVTAIVEVVAYLPVGGASMSYYGTRYVSKSLGFAMGWLYVYSLGILVPYEITAGALIIDYWDSPVNVGVWITVFIVLIIGLNLLPVEYYGESEFWFSSIKVITIIGLLILSFVLFWGGGPNQSGILGFHYWKDPGAIKAWLVSGDTGRFVAFVRTLVLSAFPFTFSPELLIATSNEMKNPRKDLEKAANRFIIRLVVFYIGTVIAIGVICPSNDGDLVSGGSNAKASAFVVGIKHAGIKGLGSVVNASILTIAWSAGNAYLYMSSRALHALAVTGQAPRVFLRCTKRGVPYAAVIACSFFGILSYLNLGSSSSTVFTWFVTITNTSAFISWVCCCIVYLRFRAAYNIQAGGQPELPYTSRMQPYGAWFCLAFFTVLTLINGFDVFFPGRLSVSSFFTAYIGIPAFIVIFVGHKLWMGRSDPLWLAAKEIDIHSGLENVE